MNKEVRSLTPEEEAKLMKLNADSVSSPKFSWDDTFQRKLLGMFLTDRSMLVQSLDKVVPGYFSNDSHVVITKILFKHFEKHKAIPEKWIMHQELLSATADREKSTQLFYQSELDSLYDYFVPGLETREYLLDKVTSFAKVQAVKLAYGKCMEKMKEDPESDETWSFVYDQMRSAMVIDRSYEPGLEYFKNIDEMFRRMKLTHEGRDRFTSAFESIDNALTGGGFFPGEICAWISLPGTGKSLAMCKAAVANVLLGHKVLYITMEMDELGIAQRFTSQFAKLDINNLLNHRIEVENHVAEFIKEKEDFNQLIIKQFPGGQMDVNSIRAYHNQLMLRGWKPNLIIIDYVGEMKDDPKLQKYESAYRILRDLRAFGIEERHGTLTAMQPNASAAKLEIGEYIDESNIGVSFDQFKPLDAFWSINQQVIEKDAEVARGFVIKHRNGRSRFPFRIGFDYATGTLDMFEISISRYSELMSLSDSKRSVDTQINMPTTDADNDPVSDAKNFVRGGKKQRSKGGFKPKQDDIHGE